VAAIVAAVIESVAKAGIKAESSNAGHLYKETR
jgi:hypothetical protein